MESKNATRGLVHAYKESVMQCLVHSRQSTLTFRRTSMARTQVPGGAGFLRKATTQLTQENCDSQVCAIAH